MRHSAPRGSTDQHGSPVNNIHIPTYTATAPPHPHLHDAYFYHHANINHLSRLNPLHPSRYDTVHIHSSIYSNLIHQ